MQSLKSIKKAIILYNFEPTRTSMTLASGWNLNSWRACQKSHYQTHSKAHAALRLSAELFMSSFGPGQIHASIVAHSDSVLITFFLHMFSHKTQNKNIPKHESKKPKFFWNFILPLLGSLLTSKRNFLQRKNLYEKFYTNF